MLGVPPPCIAWSRWLLALAPCRPGRGRRRPETGLVWVPGQELDQPTPMGLEVHGWHFGRKRMPTRSRRVLRYGLRNSSGCAPSDGLCAVCGRQAVASGRHSGPPRLILPRPRGSRLAGGPECACLGPQTGSYRLLRLGQPEKRRPLRGQRHRSGLGQRRRQPGQHRQVGVERDPLDAANPQGGQRPVVLEPPELALDRAALPVEVLPAQ
jgi:hypothetical protein